MTHDEDELTTFLGIALGTIFCVLLWAVLILSVLLIWWPTGPGVPPLRIP